MQYHVIHSSDPYLLARLCTDLQMEGRIKAHPFYIDYTPFCKLPMTGLKCNYLIVYEDNDFHFTPNMGVGYPIRHTLTARNYTQVLIKILEQ